MSESPTVPLPAGTAVPPSGVAGPTGDVVPFRKTVSRMRCLEALRRDHRAGYLLDVGDRYIIAFAPPQQGDFIRVDRDGYWRYVSQG